MRLNGFTLAEVLITLGIIGIVAAMTMPALIANSKKTEYSSKLKKFYSVMNQAILMSEQDNGEAGEWLKEGGIEGDIKDEDNNPDFGKNSDVILKFVNQYLKPYLKIIQIEKSNRTVNDGKDALGEAYMVFADGSYVYLHNGNCIDFNYDVNGPKPPNEYGRDIYKFLLCSNEKCNVQTWNTNCGKFTANTDKGLTREEALTGCKNKPMYCTKLLQIDNFEFKKDYPHRL
ncbi:putative General secretion pathway protein H [Clostridium sp. CAG:967]|nr:putative General secretion pathway protein H [Clostridium sp. CAG:967]